MSEVNALVAVSATSIMSNEATLKAAIAGIGTIVELRPGTLALSEKGLQVQAQLDKIAPDLEIASTITIDSAEMLEEAQDIAGRLASACADSGLIEEERKALTSPFNDLVKKVNEGYNAPRNHVTTVLNGLKTKILAYNREQQRLQAIKDAEEAAKRQKAAEDAAKAEAEANAAANELLIKAQEAQAAGSEITAQALIQQAAVKVDESRQHADVAVTALHTRTVSAPAVQAKGVRGKWKAVVLNKAALVQHIAERLAAGDESLLNLLDVNESNLNKLADMQKQALKLPGTKPEFTESLAVRKAVAA